MNHKVVNGVNNKEKGVTVNLENGKDGKKSALNVDVVLLSIGRHAYTDGLQLDKAGLKADDRGVIHVNKTWQTDKPGIYAIGDVTPGPMLAHKAEEEGIAAIEHIMGEGGHVNYDAIPGVIYTDPEVAWVGKTEEELKADNIKFKKGVFPFSANSRARCN